MTLKIPSNAISSLAIAKHEGVPPAHLLLSKCRRSPRGPRPSPDGPEGEGPGHHGRHLLKRGELLCMQDVMA